MTKKIEVFASEAQQGELENFPNIKRGWGVTKESTGGIPPMKWFNSIQKRTDEAINAIAEGSISGYTFKDGATLESHNDLIYDEASKSWYFWIGESGKVIPPDSNASDIIESDGGIWSEINPDGLWVNIGDGSLRAELSSPTGTNLIGYLDNTLTNRLGVFATPDDYNGTDSEKLQQAVNSGKPVCIPFGTTLIVDSIDLTSKDVNIFGGGTLQLSPSKANKIHCIFNGNPKSFNLTNVILKGDRFNQSIDGIRTDSYDWLRKRSVFNGVCDSLTVIGCDVSEFFTIQFIGSGDYWTFRNNNFHDNDKDAVATGWIKDAYDGEFYCKHFEFINNRVTRVGYKVDPSDTRQYAFNIPQVTGNGLLVNNTASSLVMGNYGEDIDRNFCKWQGMRKDAFAFNNIAKNTYDGTDCNFAMFAFAYFGGKDLPTTNDNISNNTSVNWHGMIHFNSGTIVKDAVISNNITNGVTSGTDRNGVYGIKKCKNITINNCINNLVNSAQCAMRLVMTDGDIEYLSLNNVNFTTDSYCIEHSASGGTGKLLNTVIDSSKLTSKSNSSIRFDVNNQVDEFSIINSSVNCDSEKNILENVSQNTHYNFEIMNNSFSKYVHLTSNKCRALNNVVKNPDSTGRTIITSSTLSPSDMSGDIVESYSPMHIYSGVSNIPVNNLSTLRIHNTNPINIVNFINGHEGKLITVGVSGGNTTFKYGSIRFKSGQDYKPSATTVIQFMLLQNIWYEV